MQDFMMIFHNETKLGASRPSPEEFQASVKKWQDWIGGIAAEGKFKGTNALNHEGRVLHATGTVTDGPYTELKECVGGYLLLQAADFTEALQLAEGCPTLAYGGKVEIRSIMDLGQ